MIRGRVDFTLEAVVVVPAMDGNGQFRPVEFVIDTGFDGYLSLPLERIQLDCWKWGVDQFPGGDCKGVDRVV